MTPPLGDFFPPEEREGYCDGVIKAGAVFCMRVEHTTPPKLKRFIVIGFNEDRTLVGFLFINSEINPRLFPSPHLKSLHLPLCAEDCSYVDHDSFLDCSRLYEMNFQTLKEKCVADIGIYLGEATATDFEKIINLTASATTIETKKKRKFNLLNPQS